MTLGDALVFSALVGEVSVLSALLWRRTWKVLPVFSLYMLWAFITDAATAVVHWRFQSYYSTIYLIQFFPDAIFQFLVLLELAWAVLRPNRASLPKGTLIVLFSLLLLAGAAIWPLAKVAVLPGQSAHFEFFAHFQQTVAILRVVFFLVMAGFSQILAIGWKDRELQVASGFGFYAIISLIVAVMHSHQADGPQYEWLDRAVVASYLSTLAYWVLSFSTKEQERREFSPQMQQILVQMGGGVRSGRVALTNIPPKQPRKRD